MAGVGSRWSIVWALLLVVRAPAQLCSGDCDSDTVVSGSEVLAGVGIALDDAGLASCAALDADQSGGVSVAEVVAAINAAQGAVLPPGNPKLPPGTVSIDVGVVAGTSRHGDFPVTLDSGGLQVAGIQNDIAFDPLTPVASPGGPPDCTANPATARASSPPSGRRAAPRASPAPGCARWCCR